MTRCLTIKAGSKLAPTAFSVCLQRRRRTTIRAQVVLSFEEAAKGAKRTIRIAQGLPEPKNVEVDIPAGKCHVSCQRPCHLSPMDVQVPAVCGGT